MAKYLRILFRFWKIPLVVTAGFYLTVVMRIAGMVYSDTKVNSDAILVLGAKIYKGNDYNPCLVARVKHVVVLQKQGFAESLILSGGEDGESKATEAEVMAKIVETQGADENKIILEEESTSTHENIANSITLAKQQGMDSVIIVTEPFHAPRASMVAMK